MRPARGSLFRRTIGYGLLQVVGVAALLFILNALFGPFPFPSAEIALYSLDGRLLSSNGPNPPPPLSPQMLARIDEPPPRPRAGPPPLIAFRMHSPDGTQTYARIRLQPQLGSRWGALLFVLGAVVVVVALISIPAARALSSPLERLTAHVRRVAAGDLTVRTQGAGPGEVGELAQAFDEMVERIGVLLRNERKLLADISHELRTPLSRIRVALELAAEADPARAREHLEGVTGDLAEVDRLIEDVLVAARLDAAGQSGEAQGVPMPLRREAVSCEELLAQAMAHFQRAHSRRPLETALSAALGTLDADAVLLRRAIDNVLDNAAKYSEAPVRLEASTEAGALKVRVIDRGIGIAPADLPRLFTPFFRADHSRTRATGGVGLGLALAKRIVEAHRGAIEVQSVEGSGTTVTITLPAKA